MTTALVLYVLGSVVLIALMLVAKNASVSSGVRALEDAEQMKAIRRRSSGRASEHDVPVASP